MALRPALLADKSALARMPIAAVRADRSLRLAAGNQLQVGKTYSARVFDPSTMSDRETTLSITARDTMIVPDSARWDDGK